MVTPHTRTAWAWAWVGGCWCEGAGKRRQRPPLFLVMPLVCGYVAVFLSSISFAFPLPFPPSPQSLSHCLSPSLLLSLALSRALKTEKFAPSRSRPTLAVGSPSRMCFLSIRSKCWRHDFAEWSASSVSCFRNRTVVAMPRQEASSPREKCCC